MRFVDGFEQEATFGKSIADISNVVHQRPWVVLTAAVVDRVLCLRFYLSG